MTKDLGRLKYFIGIEAAYFEGWVFVTNKLHL